MKKSNKMPKVGDKIKFMDKNPNKHIKRVLQGIVSKVSPKFGGTIYVKNVTSNSEYIIRYENIIKQ